MATKPIEGAAGAREVSRGRDWNRRLRACDDGGLVMLMDAISRNRRVGVRVLRTPI